MGRISVTRRVSVAAAVVCLPVAAFAGPDWVETADAGSTLLTAQVPTGTSGSLNTISGSLTGGFIADFEDCYIIRIVNPTAFSMTVTTANFDTQIFLFNITLPLGAYGLLANDDISETIFRSRFANQSNDGTNVFVTLPGDYMVAVSGFNRDPVALSGPGGQLGGIFNQATSTEISGPDGPGGFNAMAGWQGSGEFGNYTVTLTGCTFPEFPAPGTAGLFALAGLAGMRRRR